MKEINQRLRRCRILAGYNQAEAGEFLGLKCSTYSQKERKGNFTCEEAIKLAEFFCADINYILYGKTENTIPVPSPEAKPSKPPKLIPETEILPLSDKEKSLIKTIRFLNKRKLDKFYEFLGELVKEK